MTSMVVLIAFNRTVRHHIVLSLQGMDRIPILYYMHAFGEMYREAWILGLFQILSLLSVVKMPFSIGRFWYAFKDDARVEILASLNLSEKLVVIYQICQRGPMA